MFTIDEITVDESVVETHFACDLLKCKGACCTFPGGRGAPLRDDEVQEIVTWYPAIESMLPELHKKTIAEHGLIEGERGMLATQCVDGKACVFVYYEGEIAKCAFEKAFQEGKIPWRKPISCHLFPIRMQYSANKMQYEYFHECEPALERGKNENIPLYKFVQEPLRRALGNTWTEHLVKEIESSV